MEGIGVEDVELNLCRAVRTVFTGSLLLSLVVALMAAGTVGLVGYRLGGGIWPFAVALAVAVAVVLRPVLVRARAVREPFPNLYRTWLTNFVPVYQHGTPDEQARFEALVLAFLAEQRFEQVKDEVPWTWERKLAVAAGAATLLLGRPGWTFTTRRSFLLYPETFDRDYFDGAGHGDFDGMAHQQGPVIFAAHALDVAWAYEDASNVVLHELAHLLDYAGDTADGIPSLLDPASAPAWERLVRRETQRIRVGKSMLRSYAATNGAEFFAVATEVFFEKPVPLARRHRELFDAFVAFYAYDPRPPAERTDAAPEDDEDGDGEPDDRLQIPPKPATG